MLACTHYPLVLDSFARLAPWPVDWIDPAPAIARRVTDLIGKPKDGTIGAARAIFTSGARPSAALAGALAGFGLKNAMEATGDRSADEA